MGTETGYADYLKNNPDSVRGKKLCTEAQAILGRDPFGATVFEALLLGYLQNYVADSVSGSFVQASKELDDAAAAANAFATALKNLYSITSWKALLPPTEEKLLGMWRDAGGSILLDKMVGFPDPPPVGSREEAARRTMQGLWLLYDPELLNLFGKFCATQSHELYVQGDKGGKQTAYRATSPSPTMYLMKNCQSAIEKVSGDSEKMYALARVVHELVTGQRPVKRWAEREKQECTRTPPKKGESPV